VAWAEVSEGPTWEELIDHLTARVASKGGTALLLSGWSIRETDNIPIDVQWWIYGLHVTYGARRSVRWIVGEALWDSEGTEFPEALRYRRNHDLPFVADFREQAEQARIESHRLREERLRKRYRSEQQSEPLEE
jgi:hypothetical protein